MRRIKGEKVGREEIRKREEGNRRTFEKKGKGREGRMEGKRGEAKEYVKQKRSGNRGDERKIGKSEKRGVRTEKKQ